MKYSSCSIFILLILSSYSVYPQDIGNRRYGQNEPILIRPTSHDANFKDFPARSFYSSRNDWAHIIDSTWGPGLPLSSKLNIFNQYTSALRNQFDGFLSLGMNWPDIDTLINNYESQIDSSTSRGRFCALMNYLTGELKDAHTVGRDNGVFSSPLNPGVPILFANGFVSVDHFGAVVTVLPDSSVLVLRTVNNHPLGLQPGDIILGYEGIPYKSLIEELLQAELPGALPRMGAESARAHHLFIGAGMNWHLFNTIDVLQYSTGDTLHLSVAPMINLNVPPMLNNEQVEIPGIPFPDYFNDEIVTYGFVDGANIGYIYLFSEWEGHDPHPDLQFYNAVNALRNTEGLIIDMRWNEGGWAFFDEAFDILFNDFSITIEDAYRSSPTTLTLSPSGNAPVYQINGDPNSLYDHPIAVLLGPLCYSMGDVTAQRFRYHPMVRFFGKPPAACLGDNLRITNFSDWYLRYSISDMFHVNNPGNYLNRQEFPIDFPVWHNADDVANGIDAVVAKARSWINSMIYAHNVKPYSSYIRPVLDTLAITATVENPPNHNLTVAAIIDIVDSINVDSLPMFDDGNHGDSLAGDGLYGAYINSPVPDENTFKINVSVTDLDSSHYHILPNAARFTTIGPVIVDTFEVPSFNQSGFVLKLFLRNDGVNATAADIRAEITTSDTNVTNIMPNNIYFGDIAPGQIKSSVNYNIATQNNPATVDFIVHISSDGLNFWSDSITVPVGCTFGLLGDVNDDIFVNSADGLIILSYDAALTIPQPILDRINIGFGDVNEDGITNSTDGLIILSYDAGITVPFPVGDPVCLPGTTSRSHGVTKAIPNAGESIGISAVSTSKPIARGMSIDIPVTVDMSETSEKLGSYTAELEWNPEVFEFVSQSGGTTEGFENPVVNEKEIEKGKLIFAHAYPYGADKKVNILNVQLKVLSEEESSSSISLNFSAMAAARTFVDLLPYLQADAMDMNLESVEVPNTYSVLQYPNPFNPTTTFEFSLPHSGFVLLKIYNILGEEVAKLVSERLAAGEYQYEWDAGNLASGVYLYKIQASDYVEVKKMILQK